MPGPILPLAFPQPWLLPRAMPSILYRPLLSGIIPPSLTVTAVDGSTTMVVVVVGLDTKAAITFTAYVFI